MIKYFIEYEKILKDIPSSVSENSKKEGVASEFNYLSHLPHHDKEAENVVTFVCPRWDRNSFYKMLVPCYAFNHYSKNYKSYITQIGEYSDKHIDDLPININAEFTLASNWIVLPFTMQDITSIVNVIKSNNPNCNIAYMVDFDYRNIPEQHPQYKRCSGKSNIDIIEHNMAMSNLVLFNSKEMMDYSIDLMKGRDSIKGVDFSYIPTFFSEELMEQMDAPQKNKKSDKKRIGIAMKQENWSDINSNLGVFKAIKKLKDKATFVTFDFDGIFVNDKGEKKNALRSASSNEYNKSSSIKNYFQDLINLDLDAAIFPYNDTVYNKNSLDIARVLEFGEIGVPVLVQDIPPLNIYIKNGINGSICDKKEDWIFQINTFMEVDTSEDNKIFDMKKTNFDNIWKNYNIDNPQNIKILESIFN